MTRTAQIIRTARAVECATNSPLHARLCARFSGAPAMVIQPKVRGFLCTTTHPTGCFENVRRQAEHVRSKGDIADGPKRVLVLGASTGYGLASRITAAFGSGASTIGVFFEKPGTDRKPGTAGWYNSAGFHQLAEEAGLFPDIYNLAINKLGTSKNIIVEDSPPGIQSGKSSGNYVVAIDRGIFSKKELSNADVIVEELTPDLFIQINKTL